MTHGKSFEERREGKITKEDKGEEGRGDSEKIREERDREIFGERSIQRESKISRQTDRLSKNDTHRQINQGREKR